MQKIGFSEALEAIVAQDPRYHRDAYAFLRDALDYTIKSKKRAKDESDRHVSGPELLEGFRMFALKEFGPMVPTVFDYWGLRRCEDVGHMVFNLIASGIFGKTDRDSIQDFSGGYDFHEAFVGPFLPPDPSPRSGGEIAEPLPAVAPAKPAAPKTE